LTSRTTREGNKETSNGSSVRARVDKFKFFSEPIFLMPSGIEVMSTFASRDNSVLRKNKKNE
jgi:hypothetical protein